MIFKTKELEKRYSIFPIQYQDLWNFYNVNKKQPWLAEDADLSKDKYDELLPNEQTYLKNILAFFTISDGLVVENLATMFLNQVDILEAQYFYGNQIAIENIHAEAYSLLIDTYIKDLKEKKDLFNSMETNLAVSKKASWAKKWLDSASIVHRLIAFACVEGLSFSSVFAGVFWFRSRNKMEGLGAMNELIIRDETSHYRFAVYLYNNYVSDDYLLKSEDIKQIILECYEVEKVFVEESMPDGLSGLTKDNMVQYVQFVTDTILNDFGIPNNFNVNNPLLYMGNMGLFSKNNFFEQRVGQYTKVEIPTNNANIFDDEF